MRSWRNPLVALAVVTVGTLALFVGTAAGSAANHHAAHPLTKAAKRVASKPATLRKQVAPKASSRPPAAMTKAHRGDKPDKHHNKKTCEHGRDDCVRHHCEHGRDDCTPRKCEHGRDDCTTRTCEQGRGDCEHVTCSEHGDDCAPKSTCPESGDDCQAPAPEQTTSEETQGQLPFTGGNVLGIGGLGLLLSGGGLLLIRRRRSQS